jgi:CBS domain-containing protein
MSDPGIGEKRDEIGRGSDQVRMFVSDTLIRVGHDATVRELARRMAAEGVGALVVTEGDQVHGIVSERDIVVALAAGKDLDSMTAADIDSRRLVTCTPSTSVQEAAVLMMEHYVRHLLVNDDTGPVGIVSARDLLGVRNLIYVT